jgi:hypothetical protein
MKIERIVPVLHREYLDSLGGFNYIGETETHFLVTVIDREGYCNNVVYALSKDKYRVTYKKE